MPSVRLQKWLASAGVCSRRKGEVLIQAGRVAVNGQVVTELGTKIDPAADRVAVDGRPVAAAQEALVYIIVNKPRGVVTSCEQEGVPVVVDLVSCDARIYPVGRLDKDSTGLVLLIAAGAVRDGGFSVGDFALFIAYLPRLTGTMSFLGVMMVQHKRAGVAFERTSRLLRDADLPITPFGVVERDAFELDAAGTAESLIDAVGLVQPRNLQRRHAGELLLHLVTDLLEIDRTLDHGRRNHDQRLAARRGLGSGSEQRTDKRHAAEEGHAASPLPARPSSRCLELGGFDGVERGDCVRVIV